jgi:hypothetical protein
MKTLKIILSLFLVFSTAVGFAQDDTDDFHTVAISIPQVALVDIESTGGSNNLTLGFDAPTEAGEPLMDPTDDTSLWLNYSSIKSVAGTTYTVSVSLDAVLPGVDINVTAGDDAGGGDGTLGAPAGAAVTLTTGEQTIVSTIGSSYTGDGSGSGHNLTYSVDGATTGVTGNASYADLVATTGETVTVTYTITAD